MRKVRAVIKIGEESARRKGRKRVGIEEEGREKVAAQRTRHRATIRSWEEEGMNRKPKVY